VKPLRLQIEGLTSFADRAVVDFADLQLFAITGPTGAGKSSLLDAMLLALFGKVPRVDRDYKQLITHGADQLLVGFEFAARGERYRIARRIKLTGSSQVQFERVVGDATEPIADRARDVETAVERVLGFGYDAFTRAVVLPQGEFDRFLRGDPKERRGILADLLGLRRYERMAALAGERHRGRQARTADLDGRLQGELANALPERRDRLRADAAAAEQERARGEAAAKALGSAVQTALQLRQARSAAHSARQSLAAAEQQLAHLAATRASLQSEHAAHSARRVTLQEQLRAAGAEPEVAARLAAAVPLAAQLRRATDALPALRDAADRAGGVTAKLRQEIAQVDAAMPQLQAMAKERQAEVAAAEAAADAAQREHAAAHLRAGLRPGDACPVCAQPVGRLPRPPAADVDDGKATAKAARDDLRNAEKMRDDADRGRKAAQKHLPDAQRAEQEAAGRLAEAQHAAVQVSADLAKAGIAVPEPLDAAALLQSLQDQARKLAAAQQQRDGLAAELARLESLLSEQQGKVLAAAARIEVLQPQRDAHAAAAADAQTAIDAAVAALAGVAPPLAPPRAPRERDELDQLQDRQHAANEAANDASRRAGELAAQARQLDEQIALAARLRQEREQAAAEAEIARTLAQLLRADRFQDFVQEEALGLLTADGSARLRTLSQGRYSLRHDGNDFTIVDHWNADRERSVRTLSGGETFLASLALALALAERLVAVGGGGSGAALECLFLDEGFGALDRESLEAAVQALEALHGGHRMVGVITHLDALAERLPARLRVENDGGRARVVAE
jgi:exonuclease SbcC